jgi:hypothetical protein
MLTISITHKLMKATYTTLPSTQKKKKKKHIPVTLKEPTA